LRASTRVFEHHKVLVVGGGTAGVTVAVRLVRAAWTNVAVAESSGRHHYQPL